MAEPASALPAPIAGLELEPLGLLPVWPVEPPLLDPLRPVLPLLPVLLRPLEPLVAELDLLPLWLEPLSLPIEPDSPSRLRRQLSKSWWKRCSQSRQYS